jgi:hypothetical protein
VRDPVAFDVEREHGHGDAIVLGHQAGLAVDRARQDCQAGCPAGDIDQVVRHLLAAFDRVERGADQAAAVGDHRGARVQQADERVDVPGFPGLLEVSDQAGLPRGRSRGRLGGADAAARGRGQLAAGRRGPAGDLGYFGEGVAEDVVQDERDALGRGHRFEHDEKGHGDRLIQRDPVGRVGGVRPRAWPFRWFGQRLGDPLAGVAFPPGPGRAEQVQADAAGDLRQPGRGG